MSFKEWGIFLDSFLSKKEAVEFIRASNLMLAHMDLSDEEKQAVKFSIHPTYDNTKGRSWLYGVYLRMEEDYQ
jgi:hypothetical protein